MLSDPLLREKLETAYQTYHQQFRRDLDPVSFAHQFQSQADQEIVAFFAALLAYGNVTSIRSSVARVLRILGRAPYKTLKQKSLQFPGFCHRFTRGEDLEVLSAQLRCLLNEYGSLEGVFMASRASHPRDKISDFVNKIRNVPLDQKLQRLALKRRRNLKYLLSDPLDGSACKRLNLFFRWVVRPKDGIDLGLWKQHLPSALILPIDVHLLKTIRELGWTTSSYANWRIAEHATQRLKTLCPKDPLRYDFALCHLSMSGNRLMGAS